MYCIYKIVNIINNNIYIGRTNNFNRRVIEHKNQYKRTDRTNNSPIYVAMRKYGIDNFIYEIIEETDDLEKSYELEKFYIKKYRNDLGYENVYNYQNGGLGGQSHDISGINNPMYHKKLSEESIEKMRKKLIGRKLSEESIKKISHPITLINIYTKTIIKFPSKIEASRKLYCSTKTLKNNKITKEGWTIFYNK